MLLGLAPLGTAGASLAELLCSQAPALEEALEFQCSTPAVRSAFSSSILSPCPLGFLLISAQSAAQHGS